MYQVNLCRLANARSCARSATLAAVSVPAVRILFLIWAFVLACTSLLSAQELIQPLSGYGATVSAQFPIKDKEAFTPEERKIADDLRDLVSLVQSRGSDRDAVLRSAPSMLSNPLRRVSDDATIQVYVQYYNDPDGVAQAVLNAGGRVEIIEPEMSVVQCWIPYDMVRGLAADERVKRVRLPSYAMPKTGVVNSQGDAVHLCDQVRRSLNYNGAGTKVGVISDGIYGISQSQNSGDIPLSYEALSARADGDLYDGSEGLAMMEIVHDLAPGAALAFSNPGTSVEMLNAIDILHSTFRCDVICDDLGFGDEPFFEDGPIAKHISQIVADGCIYTSAAGNQGSSTYHESDYRGIQKRIGGIWMEVEDFGRGDWNIKATVPGKGGLLLLILQWNDRWGSSCNDYDLFITDKSGDYVYARSATWQLCDDDPEEVAGVVNYGSKAAPVFIVVRRYSGSYRHMKLMCWGNGYLTEHYTSAGSIWGHPAAEGTVACGAVPWNSPKKIESYSSRGPVRIDFPYLHYRSKPDLCGADGVSVTGNGYFPEKFYGTSAAAPHIAAVCAQVWSANLAQSNYDVLSRVQCSAVDLGPAGCDPTFGYGRADALAASDFVSPKVVISSPTADSTYLTTKKTIAMSGSYADNLCVKQVSWQNIANRTGGSVALAKAKGSWSFGKVPLALGENLITVTAIDRAGNQATDQLSVTRE